MCIPRTRLRQSPATPPSPAGPPGDSGLSRLALPSLVRTARSLSLAQTCPLSLGLVWTTSYYCALDFAATTQAVRVELRTDPHAALHPDTARARDQKPPAHAVLREARPRPPQTAPRCVLSGGHTWSEPTPATRLRLRLVWTLKISLHLHFPLGERPTTSSEPTTESWDLGR